MTKKCKICGNEFETIKYGHTRVYCFDCVPYIDKVNMTKSYSITCQRRAVKKQLVKYKGGKCSVCGYDKCISALEFHHLNPEEKEFELKASREIRSMEEYYKELEKCILLCANCHREAHAENY